MTSLLLWSLVALISVQSPPSAAERLELFVEAPRELLGDREQLVRAALGAPKKTVRRKIENLHDPDVVDSLVTLYYENAEIDLWRSEDGQRESLQSVRVFSSRVLDPLGISVPWSVSALEERFGSGLKGGPWDLYFVGREYDFGSDILTVELHAGRIRSVAWEYAYD